MSSERKNPRLEGEDCGAKARLSKNAVVKTPIARLDREISKKRKGNRKFTPTTMRNGINRYFDWCEKEDRTPSIAGLMIHMKMYRDTFYRYIEYPEFRDLLEQTKLIIQEWCANDVYRTPGVAGGKIAYMKNIHGWTEKTESTNLNENRNTTVLSIEDAKAKIASLTHLIDPKLLEQFISDRYTLNQLALPKTIDVEVKK